MTLRVKLVISVTVLLFIVIAAIGLVASRSIRSILVSQTDRNLTNLADRNPRSEPSPDSDDRDGQQTPSGPFFRPYAELLVASDGTVLLSEPSGFLDEPDPLPDVSDLGENGGIVTLRGVEGQLDYRAYVELVADGIVFVRAAPLNDVATATRELASSLLVGGLVVLLIGGGVTWWMVGRTFAPVDEMVETAEAIADGDLTRRVPEADPATELGRLGESLNRMLGNIEESVGSEREARERMRVFVADASHELRTPLTAIAGYSELHRRGGLSTPDDEDRAWSRIESESRRMKNLVDDLLTLARFGQGIPLQLSEVDVAIVVQNAAADQVVSDPERTVTVTIDGPVVVTGDEERLHQVVSSLLSNVSVHTPLGTSVEVRATSIGDSVEVVVADDGPGIPLEAVDHVFDRFYRADPSRSRKSGGSGLGLAIVDAIVASHGGTVSATNGERGGATFRVVIPKLHVPRSDQDGSNAQETPSFVSARSKGGLSL